ncbi:hypothetical protein, conserved [Plasmodium vivax]|uniref:VIR protein n=1 Tax=Plasmodium vivax TaxID=5855 RepID=A0A1G4E9M5_PLAVI|nr:hypothetical protein, conserved [Plasmodium vivax]
MEKHATDDYLKYNDYSTIKRKFNRDPNYQYELKADDILQTYTVNDTTKSTYMNSYKELFRHIHNGAVMSEYMIKGCKYISYMLHKYVIGKFKYDFETFKIFHNFVEAYYKQQRSNDKLCLPNMVYIDDDKYEEIDALYRLYDEYTKFLSSIKPTKESSCKDLKFLVATYNQYITDHKSTSNHLNLILEDLEKHLSRTIDNNKNGCSYNYTLKPINKYIEENTQQPIKDNQETHPPITSTLIEKQSLTAQPEVTSPHDTFRHNEGTYIEAQTLMPRESNGRITHDLEKHQGGGIHHAIGTEEDEDRRNVKTSLPDRRTLRTFPHYDPLSKLALNPGVESSEQLKLMGEPSLYPQNGLEKDQGVMANVRNTITEVLGSVEPGPVLGVSGGMGVLFLLFKYTPVGFFFGGRRGRFRQIPHSFNGPFPGEFPNFQDYEGGYIGYGPTSISSLAE